jgi:hypothetical protein
MMIIYVKSVYHDYRDEYEFAYQGDVSDDHVGNVQDRHRADMDEGEAVSTVSFILSIS